MNKYKHTYSQFDVLMASPTDPLPKEKRDRQLTKIRLCMVSIEQSPHPTLEQWEVLSDIVNMMQTLLETKLIEDRDDVIGDAITALAKAGTRHLEKKVPIRFEGRDIAMLHGVIEDYEMVIENLPARTMLAIHRKTEKRVQDILAGRCKQEDVRVSI